MSLRHHQRCLCHNFGTFVFNSTEGDSISIADSESLDLTDAGAIEFWMNYTTKSSPTHYMQIISKGDDLVCVLGGDKN